MQNLILTPLMTAFFRSLSVEEQNAIARIYFGVDTLNPADDADLNYKVFMALGRNEAPEASATASTVSAPAKAEAVDASTSDASQESDCAKQSDSTDATAPAADEAPAPVRPTPAPPVRKDAVDDSHLDDYSRQLMDKVPTLIPAGARPDVLLDMEQLRLEDRRMYFRDRSDAEIEASIDFETFLTGEHLADVEPNLLDNAVMELPINITSKYQIDSAYTQAMEDLYRLAKSRRCALFEQVRTLTAQDVCNEIYNGFFNNYYNTKRRLVFLQQTRAERIHLFANYWIDWVDYLSPQAKEKQKMQSTKKASK
ncbi:MAG: hypothetical protein ACI391_04935 [Muribaculaceae bacterium]